MENTLKGPSWHSEKCFQAEGTCGEQGNRIRKIRVHTEFFSHFTLPLLSAFFMPKSLPNSSLYTPHPTFLSPVPLGPSLYFSFLFRTPFSFLLYASPLVSMGTPFGRGVVLMISPTCWNFVTFLTLLRGSYCELEHRTFGSHACFLSF